jgi:hypothetical protein
MAVQTLPVNLDFTVFAGTTFRREFRWRPGGLTGQNFTGWTASLRIGPARGEPLVELTDGNGVTLAADGVITVGMSPTTTRSLDAGAYSYVLDLTDDLGTVLRLLRGRMTVVRELE